MGLSHNIEELFILNPDNYIEQVFILNKDSQNTPLPPASTNSN